MSDASLRGAVDQRVNLRVALAPLEKSPCSDYGRIGRRTVVMPMDPNPEGGRVPRFTPFKVVRVAARHFALVGQASARWLVLTSI